MARLVPSSRRSQRLLSEIATASTRTPLERCHGNWSPAAVTAIAEDVDPVASAVLTAHGGVNDALLRLVLGGTLVVFAAPEHEVPTNLDSVYRKELHVVGSRSATPAYFRDAVELLPALVLPEVTTMPLERFAEGVELYRRGDALKVVFVP